MEEREPESQGVQQELPQWKKYMALPSQYMASVNDRLDFIFIDNQPIVINTLRWTARVTGAIGLLSLFLYVVADTLVNWRLPFPWDMEYGGNISYFGITLIVIGYFVSLKWQLELIGPIIITVGWATYGAATNSFFMLPIFFYLLPAQMFVVCWFYTRKNPKNRPRAFELTFIYLYDKAKKYNSKI